MGIATDKVSIAVDRSGQVLAEGTRKAVGHGTRSCGSNSIHAIEVGRRSDAIEGKDGQGTVGSSSCAGNQENGSGNGTACSTAKRRSGDRTCSILACRQRRYTRLSFATTIR